MDQFVLIPGGDIIFNVKLQYSVGISGVSCSGLQVKRKINANRVVDGLLGFVISDLL